MANSNAPFGFKYDGIVGGGAAPTVSLISRQIKSTYATKIFHGDLVVNSASGGSGLGYIEQAAASPTTGQIAGVFNGCHYLSLSQGKVVYSPFWPGADAAANSVTAEIIPLVYGVPLQFYAQATSGPITFSSIGQNANITVGSGSTITGISAMTVDNTSSSATLPLTITGLYSGVGNGSDATTANNWVYVTLNFPGVAGQS